MKGKERAYNSREVLQLDIAQVLHRLYLDAKAEEELNEFTKDEDYKLDDSGVQETQRDSDSE